MVLVVEPVALVRCTVLMEVGTLTIRFVVLPESNIDIAICMNDSTEAFLPIIDKVAIVARAIRPHLSSTSMAYRAGPFTCVTNAVLDLDHVLCDDSQPFPPEQIITVRIVPFELLKLIQLHSDRFIIVVTFFGSLARFVPGIPDVKLGVLQNPSKSLLRKESASMSL